MQSTLLPIALTMLLALPAACGAAPTGAAPSPSDAPRPASVSAAQVDGVCSRVVDRLWVRTDQYWHAGDYPRVVALDRMITEDDPHFLEPYSTGGWLMESMDHTAEAEAYYRLGVARNPNEAYLWHQLGLFYFNTLKNYPKAIVAFQGATRQKDATVISWRMLAHSYEKNKQLPQAVTIWKTLDKRHPNDGVTMHNLLRAQAALAAQTADGGQSPSGAQTMPNP